MFIPGRGGPCYAGHYHETRLAKSLPKLYDADFTKVRMAPGRMGPAAAWHKLPRDPDPGKPWLDGCRRMIFVADMGDLFSEAVTFEYLRDEVLAAAISKQGSRHVWLWLTKRPKRAIEFGAWLVNTGMPRWPDNVWLGTSITGRASLSRARDLMGHVWSPRFLSIEPLVEDVSSEIGAMLTGQCSVCRDIMVRGGRSCRCRCNDGTAFGFDWLIVGGESDQPPHKARAFDLAWPRAIIRHARDAETPVFVKQLGSLPIVTDIDLNPIRSRDHGLRYRNDEEKQRLLIQLHDHHGGDWSEWPLDLRIREIPDFARIGSVP